MQKIFFILLLFPTLAWACPGYVIGFKGKDNWFDQQAFEQYAQHFGYCAQSYAWNETAQALKFVSTHAQPYHLYGYSLGAVSVRMFLEKSTALPERVITIGAYKTTNVNFDRFGVRYQNFFDHSGRGQTSPGQFVDATHSQIQQRVNDILRKELESKH